ncbi:SOS response-associated peptidase family protein [Afipia broomeae]|uniref:Uncharacterized protein n=1 Tax=Afipia broomeae ATCC 49717 TaxID=883078 RepID=K8PPM6_9BRAD|nr:SOS response-associated peptidase family protein [Afipia broomeae]EKS41475.1 hypothetical protein HMPREF9695_00567 [Afipia broomeae ATCC 49717]
MVTVVRSVRGCTILICGPNNAMAEIHNRMACICAKAIGQSGWAEPASNDELLALLKPCPDEWLEIFPVDKKVGNVRNKGPELVLPIGPL